MPPFRPASLQACVNGLNSTTPLRPGVHATTRVIISKHRSGSVTPLRIPPNGPHCSWGQSPTLNTVLQHQFPACLPPSFISSPSLITLLASCPVAIPQSGFSLSALLWALAEALNDKFACSGSFSQLDCEVWSWGAGTDSTPFHPTFQASTWH